MVLSDEKLEEIAEAIYHQKRNAEHDTAWGMQVMLTMLVGNEETLRVLDRVKRMFVERGPQQ